MGLEKAAFVPFRVSWVLLWIVEMARLDLAQLSYSPCVHVAHLSNKLLNQVTGLFVPLKCYF